MKTRSQRGPSLISRILPQVNASEWTVLKLPMSAMQVESSLSDFFTFFEAKVESQTEHACFQFKNRNCEWAELCQESIAVELRVLPMRFRFFAW